MNVFDYIIIAIIAVGIGIAVWRTVKRKGGCSCGCAGCKRSCAGSKRSAEEK